MKLTILLLIVSLLGSSQALHFFITEGVEKCITDDVPSQTNILGYTNLMDELPGVPAGSKTDGVTLIVYGPTNAIAFKKLTLFGKEKFAFTAHDAGTYRFCLKTTTNHWIQKNAKVRYGLRLVIGEQEQNAKPDAAKEHHITSLQTKVDAVKIRAKEFIEYQQMNSKIEDELAQANININDKVIIFTIVETITILCSGVFQIISLKRFFAQKRFTY